MYLNPMPATCRPWCSILWHQLPDSKLVHRCSLCERVRHDNTEQVPILLHGVSGKYPRTSTVNHRPDVYSYGKEAGTRSYKTSSRSFSPLPFLVCLFIHNHFLHIFFSQSATCIRCPTRMPFPTPSLSYPSHHYYRSRSFTIALSFIDRPRPDYCPFSPNPSSLVLSSSMHVSDGSFEL